jgi:hypothetical protein
MTGGTAGASRASGASHGAGAGGDDGVSRAPWSIHRWKRAISSSLSASASSGI